MKRYLFTLTVFLLIACEPDVKVQTITEQKAYLPFSIGFDVNETDGDQAYAPEVTLVSKFNQENTTPVKAINTPKAKFNYTVNIDYLEAGEYRLILRIPYRNSILGIPLWRSFKNISQDFVVHNNLPYTCYSFDDKDKGIDGWKSTHVYIDDKDKPVSQETCPGLFFVQNSWPWPLEHVAPGGSLFIPVSSECFPKTSSQVSKQSRWMFSVISPDLSTLTHWQKIKSVQFRIATNKINISVRPEINYLLGDKQETLSQPGVEISGQQWRIIEFPVNLQPDAKITHLELHLSGIPEQTVADTVNSIFIDGVCPISAQ
jgi:hypothetical protein